MNFPLVGWPARLGGIADLRGGEVGVAADGRGGVEEGEGDEGEQLQRHPSPAVVLPAKPQPAQHSP